LFYFFCLSSRTKEIEQFKGSYFFIVQGKKMDNSELFDIFFNEEEEKNNMFECLRFFG